MCVIDGKLCRVFLGSIGVSSIKMAGVKETWALRKGVNLIFFYFNSNIAYGHGEEMRVRIQYHDKSVGDFPHRIQCVFKKTS